MKLRAIRNRDDDFVICHDQLCKKGDTSIVAHVWVSGPHADQIEKQFNAPQFSFEELNLIGRAMTTWRQHVDFGWEETHTAVVEKVRVAYSNLARDQVIRESV
ncbi:MAG: hypothetical protein EOQ39_18615 [Mesorhizobium sp.]|uniref:hypothetical protein n=1 Tax=Mesorhizobium sp. TaxID=1871066 RepID=UPI000FE77CCB|nr:hypothetical protein [Mesorhizobium sp.]RWB08817.1 MAG: hypothetical protein EOQ37_04730 [Mesorhizobium sp.]RWB13533.1 MAG: hypothetical protein EOQ39_18615 [Mesorhizobium sp.]